MVLKQKPPNSCSLPPTCVRCGPPLTLLGLLIVWPLSTHLCIILLILCTKSPTRVRSSPSTAKSHPSPTHHKTSKHVIQTCDRTTENINLKIKLTKSITHHKMQTKAQLNLVFQIVLPTNTEGEWRLFQASQPRGGRFDPSLCANQPWTSSCAPTCPRTDSNTTDVETATVTG